MLDHFVAKNATAHKVISYYTLAISYCTFCVEKHTILGPALRPLRHLRLLLSINQSLNQSLNVPRSSPWLSSAPVCTPPAVHSLYAAACQPPACGPPSGACPLRQPTYDSNTAVHCLLGGRL